MKSHILKLIPVYLLLLFTSFHSYSQQQSMSLRDFLGLNKTTPKDTSRRLSNGLFGNVLYSGPGIVLYDDYFPTLDEAENDGACLNANNSYTYSRCGSFTVPADQPYSKMDIGGWIWYYGGSYCLPTNWSWSLRNSSNQLMQEPYYVAPGQTYTYCLSATLASTSCTISSMCLTPSAKAIEYKLEHHLKNASQTTLLHTLPDNSLIFSRDYFALCADGSTASEFRITGQPATESLKWKLRIAQDINASDKDKYGYFDSPVSGADGIKFTYNHPKIPPVTNTEFAEYTIEIYDTNNSNAVVKSFKLRVYRAPLLMIHGKKDDGDSYNVMFNSFKSQHLYNSDLMLRADYGKTSNEAFATNSGVLRAHIDKLLGNVTKNKYAAAKVDIVAHSMGGLLSRIYLQSGAYKSDINKLITHNTPHSGSQPANRLTDPNFGSTVDGQISRYFGKWGGAAIDLQVGAGNTIATTVNNSGNLNKNMVPSHTITTTHPYDPTNPQSLQPTFGYVEMFKYLGMTPNQLFRTDASDLVVAFASQTGGLTGTQTSNIQPQIHSQAQENTTVINQIKVLLAANPKGNLFSQTGFKPIDTLRYVAPPSARFTDIVANGSISIVQPVNNKIVNLGNQLNFNITGTNLTKITVYIIIKEGLWQPLTTNGNSLNMNITIDNKYKVGVYEFIAIGTSTNQGLVFKEGTFEVVNCVNAYNALNGTIDQPDYQAKTTIIASGKIAFGEQINLSAEKSITLNPGFESDKFTLMEAKIIGCSN